MKLLASTTLLATLALAAPAAGATVQDDLAAAHAYWGSAVCAGQWVVTPDSPEQAGHRSGAATGIGFTYNPTGGTYTDPNGHRWDWHIDRCEFTVNPNLQGTERRCTITHEVGHFIHGPGHDGPMSPRALEQGPACAEPSHTASAHAPVRRSSRRALVLKAVRKRLPAARTWRVACTPTRPAMRCRASRGARSVRYSVRLRGPKVAVRRIVR